MSRDSIPPLVTREEERNRLLLPSGVGGDVLVVQLTKNTIPVGLRQVGPTGIGGSVSVDVHCGFGELPQLCIVGLVGSDVSVVDERRHSRDVARESVSWGVVFTFDVAQVRGELRDEVDVAQLSR